MLSFGARAALGPKDLSQDVAGIADRGPVGELFFFFLRWVQLSLEGPSGSQPFLVAGWVPSICEVELCFTLKSAARGLGFILSACGKHMRFTPESGGDGFAPLDWSGFSLQV